MFEKASAPLFATLSFWDGDKYTGDLFYDLSKNAMNRMALGLGKVLNKEDITVVAASPAYLKTERVVEVLTKDPSLAEKFGTPPEYTPHV
jgi:NAD(P)-dependent dehydrogenase (short-subunit alcohol dehydrogenase family)